MKNPSKPKSTRSLSGRALQLLALHSNSSGEISPSLEAALLLAGPKASVATIPAKTLATHAIEGSALLIRGRKTIIWSASGSLSAVAELAKVYEADIAANWIAHFASRHYNKPTRAESNTREVC